MSKSEVEVYPKALPEQNQTHESVLNDDIRIATRYRFEGEIVIRVRRLNQTIMIQPWARDLSESGLGAFVGKELVVGENVAVKILFSSFDKTEIPARVIRRAGTRYGFQFLALNAEQRLEIRKILQGEPHQN